MTQRDYIPGPDIKFIPWANRVVSYSKENCQRWMAPSPVSIIGNTLDDFIEKHERVLDPNSGKVDMTAKKSARKIAEKMLRNYIQGFIARNPNVTTIDREQLGLGMRDLIPTPVGDPVGLVTATVKYVNKGALKLSIRHVEGSPYDKRANYGVKIAYGIFPFDVPVPDDVNMLTNSVFVRRKNELFIFDSKDSRKTACFCLRYENSKGRAGQWCPVISAVIP